MDLFQSEDKILTLKEAAQKLSVAVDVLLQWNDFNILKPTITSTGEIVYFEKQIDKFIEIQQLSQSLQVYGKKQPLPQNRSNLSQFSRTLNSNFFAVSVGVFVSVFILSILTTMLILHTSNSALSANLKPFDQKTAQSPTTTPNNVNITIPENKVDTIFVKKFEGVDLTSNTTQPQVLGTNTDRSIQISMKPNMSTALNNVGYSQISNFTAAADKTHNAFDESGNIKGETSNPDIIGMPLAVNRIMRADDAIKPVINVNIILTALIPLIVGSLAIIFILNRNRLAYSIQSHTSLLTSRFSKNKTEEKVLEVDQKMDGTVVLNFQGKELKLCKPELDSESDQFIGRLLGLSNDDSKEIDYDNSLDEHLRVTAPLSKLVTRLGFVGVKRDLFFPRTSKNKVLFRKFITEKDLRSMKLTSTQIAQELYTTT